MLLTLVVMLSIASPAVAATPTPPGVNGIYSLVGTITALDSTAGTVTVHVIQGNILVKPFRGKDVVLTTTAYTKFLKKVGTTVVVIKFSDLVVGDTISSNGKIVNGVWKAYRITVNPLLIHQ